MRGHLLPGYSQRDRRCEPHRGPGRNESATFGDLIQGFGGKDTLYGDAGGDLAAGERPQLFVPGDTFHTSRLAAGGAGYALLASTEWPGVEPPDVEHGNIEKLVAAYPDFRDQIRRFTG